jgi:hypothetical protein
MPPNAPTTTASPTSPARKGEATTDTLQPMASAPTAAIPGYETMTFEQRRLAQDQSAARRNSR